MALDLPSTVKMILLPYPELSIENQIQSLALYLYRGSFQGLTQGGAEYDEASSGYLAIRQTCWLCAKGLETLYSGNVQGGRGQAKGVLT